ncbi:MAG TPA: hypothetical protein VGC47_06780 [Acidimicrobiia bacterium]|jgi:hypothetical protein
MQRPTVEQAELDEFFAERIPDWFEGEVQVTFDDAEILVVGRLPAADDPLVAIDEHREETRAARMHIAAEAEGKYLRKVGWGARCGDTGVLFTHLSIPAMTRLRLSERRVLDTLVDGGVARSRSDALAWCVRMVEKNLDVWLAELREALVHVEEVRRRGPGQAPTP